MLEGFAQWFLFAMGLLSGGGGIWAFYQHKSKPSLYGGLGFGAVFLVAWIIAFFSDTWPPWVL